MPARAVIFDFNGTLSDDEPIMYRVYAELFAAYGRPLSPLEYRDRLAGHTDEEIMRRWLGPRDDLPVLVRRRVDLYRASVPAGATISEPMRRIVRSAAARVPVGIVSGAARMEVAAVLSGARLTQSFAAVVTADDVRRGKPHADGYLLALERFRVAVPDLDAGQVTVFEDTEAGVASAKSAGMRCVAVLGTLPRHRLLSADEVAERIDQPLLDRVLG